MKISRRNTLKSIGASSVWVTPVIQTVILPAHAQTSGVACTTEIVAGLKVSVTDENTQENISCIAIAVITEGSYIETLSNRNCMTQGVLEGAFERAGTYFITVSAPGYIDAGIVDGVIVSENECHVETVNMNIVLSPEN